MSKPIKTVTLELPAEFLDLCEAHKVDPEVVLRGFIADLAEIISWHDAPRSDGYGSHGSDEREAAWHWFDRVGYTALHD